eukprot:SAG31_NODE_1621_length_7724_cov_3.297049_4_plen_474_part_00
MENAMAGSLGDLSGSIAAPPVAPTAAAEKEAELSGQISGEATAQHVRTESAQQRDHIERLRRQMREGERRRRDDRQLLDVRGQTARVRPDASSGPPMATSGAGLCLLLTLPDNVLELVLTSVGCVALARLRRVCKVFSCWRIERAAAAMVHAWPRRERCPRQGNRPWLSILRELHGLDCPLKLHVSIPMLDGSRSWHGGAFRPAWSTHPGEAVCSDHPMRAGVHMANFIISASSPKDEYTGRWLGSLRPRDYHGAWRPQKVQKIGLSSMPTMDQSPAPGKAALSESSTSSDSDDRLGSRTDEITRDDGDDDIIDDNLSPAHRRRTRPIIMWGSAIGYDDDDDDDDDDADWSGRQGWGPGDVLGLRCDMDRGTLTAFKNGVRVGHAAVSAMALAKSWCWCVAPRMSHVHAHLAWSEPTSTEAEAAGSDHPPGAALHTAVTQFSAATRSGDVDLARASLIAGAPANYRCGAGQRC